MAGGYGKACGISFVRGFMASVQKTYCSPDIVPVHWAHFGHTRTFISIASPRLKERAGERDTHHIPFTCMTCARQVYESCRCSTSWGRKRSSFDVRLSILTGGQGLKCYKKRWMRSLTHKKPVLAGTFILHDIPLFTGHATRGVLSREMHSSSWDCIII